MKLHYFQRPAGNFGDDLNPWLWNELLPGVLDDDDGTLFVGIGTLLNHRLPNDRPLVVLGTGAGLGSPPRVTDRWTIYGVRGPRTASLLGLDAAAVLTDPAMAVRDYFPQPTGPRRKIGFMPHYESLDHFDWRHVAETLGLEFVDPCGRIDEVMHQIAGLETLVTEAMHGAIVSDALRTPWVGISLSPGFFAPKWADWAGSLNIQPRVHPVEPLFDVDRAATSGARLKSIVKRALYRVGIRSASWTPPSPRSSRAMIERSTKQLQAVVRNSEPQLSSDRFLNDALDRLYTAVGRFRRDWQNGLFETSARRSHVEGAPLDSDGRPPVRISSGSVSWPPVTDG